MKPAIRIRNIAKRYRLGEQHHSTIGDTLAAMFKRGGAAAKTSKQPKEIWALKDVSFDVAPGEVVGIIGRNGAGKSTLLKVLSRITEPTHGEIELHGRVSSLLEVGTGFHQELTGRDNVYLNGSILGMKKVEIDRKFDEIVDFSGVEKFLDTPVKHYSSGMQVRLAFAVAAHLEPEILIVDEVLAVGDAEFQRKCIGKMNDVAESGRTILFVSHNMAAVENLCTRGVVLDSGHVSFDGDVMSSIRGYMSTGVDAVGDVDLVAHPSRRSACSSGLVRLQLFDQRGVATSQFSMGESITFRITTAFDSAMSDLRCGLHIYNEHGSRILTLHSYIQSTRRFDVELEGVLICHIPELPLLPGLYSVVVGLASGGGHLDRVEPALHFEVLGSDFFGSGRLQRPGDGMFAVRAAWNMTSSDSQDEGNGVAGGVHQHSVGTRWT